jgi:hypothetical protein
MNSGDRHDLHRFVDAQRDRHEVFEDALRKYFRSEHDPLTAERLGFPWPT